MKTLFVLFSLTSLGWADQAADAFVTGFANAVTQSMYGKRPDMQPVPVTPVTHYTPVSVRTYWGSVNNFGTPTGLEFPTFTACQRYAFAHDEACVQVTE